MEKVGQELGRSSPMERQVGSDSCVGPQEGSAPGRSQAWGVGRAGVLCNPLKLSSLAQTSPVSGLVPPPFTPLSAPRSTPVTTALSHLQLSRLRTGPALLPLPGMSSPCHQANFSSSFKILRVISICGPSLKLPGWAGSLCRVHTARAK